MTKVVLLVTLVVLSATLTFGQPAPVTKATPSSSSKTESSAPKPTIVLPPEKYQPVRMPRFDKPPVVDGKLDDEIWKQAALLKDFYQVQPGDTWDSVATLFGISVSRLRDWNEASTEDDPVPGRLLFIPRGS